MGFEEEDKEDETWILLQTSLAKKVKSWVVGVGDVAWRGWADRLPEELLPQKVFVVSTHTHCALPRRLN